MKPRTPEHQARVEKMRARLAEMPDHDVLPVLDMIMGFGDDAIDEMGEEEVDAFLRSEGIDPKVSYVSCMGGVLAGLSRTLHDFRGRMEHALKVIDHARVESNKHSGKFERKLRGGTL